MSNYVKITDFAIKDTLPTGNPNKIASGTQVDNELNAIADAIASKQDTAEKGLANGYASLDANGDVPDTQIPNTVPRLSGTNVFTAPYSTGGNAPISLTSILPILEWNETDAAADNRVWRIYANSQQLFIGTRNDADTQSGTAIIISRSGHSITNVILQGTALTWNGNTIWHSGNDGNGSGLDADTLRGFAPDYNGVANTLATRTAQGYINAAYFNQNSAVENPVVGNFFVETGSDGFLRKASLAHVASALGPQLYGRNISTPAKPGNNKFLSTATPSGGSDGDIWYRY